MGGDLTLVDWMRRQITAGALIGPMILRAGPFVDRAKPGVPYRLVVSTESDGRRAARFLKGAGVDFIKTHNGTPRAAYFGLLSEAHDLGIHVVGHVPFSVTPEEALDAGQFGIEHVVSLVEGPVAQLVHTRGISQREAMDRFTDAYFESLAHRMVTEMRATQRQAFPQFTQMARILYQRGVRFLVGTDLGVPYIFPGFSVHDELALLVKAGLTPMEALEAATANPARALGVADMGPIRIGNIANAVLLDTDPLSDIANTTRSTPSCSAGRY